MTNTVTDLKKCKHNYKYEYIFMCPGKMENAKVKMVTTSGTLLSSVLSDVDKVDVLSEHGILNKHSGYLLT